VDLGALVQRLNWIDWAVLLIVLLAVVNGASRGFLIGVIDILGLLLTLVGALVAYRPVASWLVDLFDISAALANVVALIGVAVAIQMLYWWLVAPLLHVSRAMRSIAVLAALDRLLGIAPGALQGLVIAGMLLLPFGLLPIVPSVSAGIERSVIGGWLVNAAVANAPELESRLGRDLADGLTFLAPPQTSEESRSLDLGRVGALVPDSEAEQRMLELVNLERGRLGLPALVFDTALREVARAHSREMFELGYFSHTSPVTGSPADRIRRANIMPRVLGENLAYAPNVRIAHDGLMNSPGHRENILRPTYGRVGIGVIKSEFRGSMYTQNFRD
jgi:uncharacterized protein YkwD/uncharacterized membrane protein required for colicin V production